jgi:AbrB family looped-hinge helix DNA binding protein
MPVRLGREVGLPSTVKLSSKHQIVVPREARDALGLRPGDRLLVNVRDDGVIEMRRRPENPAAELEGLIPCDTIAEEETLWPEVIGE